MTLADAQLKAAALLRDKMDDMTRSMAFTPPASWVYNPLSYAWNAFEEYVTRFGGTEKQVLFLGMNPGPWGMAQTGVPFGETAAVRDWLKISAPIGRPSAEHPKYPVTGYACQRSEVSGRRLWGLFRQRFGSADAFFAGHFVVNYCPLLFLEKSQLKSGGEGARNLTPDKLPSGAMKELSAACDEHVRALIDILSPKYLIGIGDFAWKVFTRTAPANRIVGKILHPSPASPRSNADWPGEVTIQLAALGIKGF